MPTRRGRPNTRRATPWGRTLSDATGKWSNGATTLDVFVVTEWKWSNGGTTLDVFVFKPGVKIAGGDVVPFGAIYIKSVMGEPDEAGTNCYRA